MTDKGIARKLLEDCTDCSENQWCAHGMYGLGMYCANKDAADAIERLVAEKARLAERLDESTGAAKMWKRRYEELARKLRLDPEKLIEADAEGRAIVLPAKPGEHVFVTGKRKIVECIVDAIYIDQRGPEAVITFQCDSDCDGCPFYSPLPDPEGDFRCAGELEEAEIVFERFWEIAFLTREEAEKTMEAMTDG